MWQTRAAHLEDQQKQRTAGEPTPEPVQDVSLEATESLTTNVPAQSGQITRGERVAGLIAAIPTGDRILVAALLIWMAVVMVLILL